MINQIPTIEAEVEVVHKGPPKVFKVDFPREEILNVPVNRSRRPRRARRSKESKPEDQAPKKTIRDILPELIGDGSGRLSIPVRMGDMSYGNGYNAGMTVGITCNQSREGYVRGTEAILDIMDELFPVVSEFAYEMYEKENRGLSKRNS